MIRYTLACDSGHDFESWFPSSDAYDEQAARGLVTCPICGSGKVGKTLMAPAVARGGRGHDAARSDEAPTPSAGQDLPDRPLTAPSPLPMVAEPERRLRALLRAVRAHVMSTAEHVGPRFPDAARAMHLGEAPVRPIYGEASLDEARALIEEGIDVAPLPPAPDDRQ